MMFKTDTIEGEWRDGLVDPRLMIALWALDGYLSGSVRITSLVHHGEAGRVTNTKHAINPKTGKCEAADVNPGVIEINPRIWRIRAKQFLDARFSGLDVIIHDVSGGAEHVHIEIDPHPPEFDVILLP